MLTLTIRSWSQRVGILRVGVRSIGILKVRVGVRILGILGVGAEPYTL